MIFLFFLRFEFKYIMVFSSLFFIYAFLPVFLIIYFLVPKKLKNFVALVSSYFFYAWGEPVFVLWLLAGSVLDYSISITFPSVSKVIQKALLSFSIVLNLAILFYCKYTGFALEELAKVFPSALQLKESIEVAMPIGISFFTFQKISYLIDVYQGKAKACKRFTDYALYVALFPQLIAGPIVRYHDISLQLKERSHSFDKFLQGLWRFSLGLFKKVIIANTVAQVADMAFKASVSENLDMVAAWIGALAYTTQIYFDFSGYSDMAIGLGMMMGFKFLENFNQPYISTSISDFWRRWHISLSNWMKEYLYIPLGGNKCAPKRNYLNLWLVFLVSGLWHGAAWTFILWGVWHGTWLTIDKLSHKYIKQYEDNTSIPKRVIDGVKRIWTFIIVVFGWVLFRAESLNEAMAVWKSMLGFDGYSSFVIDLKQLSILIIGLFISLITWPTQEFYSLVKKNNKLVLIFQMILIVLMMLMVSSTLSAEKFNPFIYFRF